MSDWINTTTDLSTAFDQDFSSGTFENNALTEASTAEYTPVITGNSFNQDILDYQDPLKHAHKYQFEPLEMNLFNTHFVEPHYVEGYMRKDGTYVEGYYRDGDGNPLTNLTKEQGGGYARTNPDGNPFNNLGEKY
ncbi:DUF3892 domain-containing protein [Oceanobacillus salinisoli]|uniref:hypothetical protein n=1 Tax=Oceanobacillus salinisoli TaxID=2678611 RepID=UPI0012E25EEE|nr:hypothetical protein [Oceanobacillus salinisoli]